MARLTGIQSITTGCQHCGNQGDGGPNFRVERRVSYREQGKAGTDFYSRSLMTEQEVLVCLNPECGKVHDILREVR